jgi:hypothetical protein
MAFNFIVIKYKDGTSETKTFEITETTSSRELNLTKLYCLTSDLVESYKHYIGNDITRDNETALKIARRRLFDD